MSKRMINETVKCKNNRCIQFPSNGGTQGPCNSQRLCATYTERNCYAYACKTIWIKTIMLKFTCVSPPITNESC